jgi:hypothetical protein
MQQSELRRHSLYEHTSPYGLYKTGAQIDTVKQEKHLLEDITKPIGTQVHTRDSQSSLKKTSYRGLASANNAVTPSP